MASWFSEYQKKYEVLPNENGYLYRANKLEKVLEPGIYTMWDWKNEMKLVRLNLVRRFIQIINQEILSKDNIAFRLSFFVSYKIIDGEILLANVDHSKYFMGDIEIMIHNLSQVQIRNVLSELDSETINETRNELKEFNLVEINQGLENYGVEVEFIQIKDITFPKNIQDLFSKSLEAKIKSKTDLENARTAVAAARALKNASEIMKDDDNIRFIQMLELLSKAAEKGKHTFMIGDINQSILKNKS
jgi:regulator of protease activity HflC (stomatin/prohibitin superfamily)